MRVHLASLSIDLSYNQDKSIIIKRFPTEYETEELKKSKYKMIDEEYQTSDNQLELNIYYSPRKKQVKVRSGGNYDFNEGPRNGTNITIKIKKSEGDLINYIHMIK